MCVCVFFGWVLGSEFGRATTSEQLPGRLQTAGGGGGRQRFGPHRPRPASHEEIAAGLR